MRRTVMAGETDGETNRVSADTAPDTASGSAIPGPQVAYRIDSVRVDQAGRPVGLPAGDPARAVALDRRQPGSR